MRKCNSMGDILPLLVNTYQSGRLVPFIGAGMSAPKLTLWREFIPKLEAEAEVREPSEVPSLDARAQRACTVIRNRAGRQGFLAAIGKALEGRSGPVPESTASLAAIRWPLAITTNYDDLFFYACRNARQEIEEDWPDEMRAQVLGRSPRDCKLVYSSLTGPFDGQYIWHVQGFLGGQSGRDPKAEVPGIDDLQNQLVIGHAEYRRVTNRAPDFRRCFTEVFNSRSLLFLGSSLKEDYFLNLFGEVLDLCGPSPVPHFAFAEKGQVDVDFLADQMNITVCEFPNGAVEDLPDWLQCLRCEIEKPKARSTGWSFAMEPASEICPDLQVIRGCAPARQGVSEAAAFVARRDGTVPPQFAGRAGAGDCTESPHVRKYGDRLYDVRAHYNEATDDKAVYEATFALLNIVFAENPGVETLHLEFSGEHGSVPPVYGFIEAIRAFRAWRSERHKRLLRLPRLVVYIQADVELCLTSGRIDIRELLASQLIRFWAVIVSAMDQEPVRRALHLCPNSCLKEVLDLVGVPADSPNWSVSVCPSPRKTISKRTIPEVQSLRLVQMGVVFGSVLIFEYAAEADRKCAKAASV